MLKFQIDNGHLEQVITNHYGQNTDSLIRDFVGYIQTKQVQNDIGVSIEQIKADEGVQISSVMEKLRNKYE